MTAQATLPERFLSPRPPEDESTRPVLDVVVPVYNEQVALPRCLRALHAHLSRELPYSFRVTVADNASTDATWRIANELAAELPGVAVVHLPAKGRGGALRAVWSASDADVLAYLDVDLSTDLRALLPLIAPLVSGHSDVAIGTRLSRDSRVTRGPKREIISRGYNLLLRGTLAARFSDAQCGFKAIRADVARRLLPLVEDKGWFFDTELLVLAERSGLRIHEVPVDWVDDPDSRVDIVATALEDVRGIGRVGWALLTGQLPLAEIRRELGRDPARAAEREAVGGSGSAGGGGSVGAAGSADGAGAVPGVPAALPGQLVRFAVVGIGSTIAYALLYLVLRDPLGPQAANLFALLLTAVANTGANRRLTFGVRGRRRLARHHVQGLVVFAVGWALTSGSLALLQTVVESPARWAELTVLVVANLTVTIGRFVALRSWVFATGRRSRATASRVGESAPAVRSEVVR